MGYKLYINTNHFEKELFIAEESYNHFCDRLADSKFVSIYDYKTKKSYIFNANDINYIFVEEMPFCLPDDMTRGNERWNVEFKEDGKKCLAAYDRPIEEWIWQYRDVESFTIINKNL